MLIQRLLNGNDVFYKKLYLADVKTSSTNYLNLSSATRNAQRAFGAPMLALRRSSC
jgi:hypothetical protein